MKSQALGGGEPAVLGALNLDVVFPVLHGPYGEDGTIQGLLELANIPYVGPGVLASAAGMDKAVMKVLFAARGLPLCAWRGFVRADWERSRSRVLDDVAALGYPMFVKPANLGSSVGISKVKSQIDLVPAIELALAVRSQSGGRSRRAERARDRMRGARQRRARGVAAGRDHPVAGVLRLRSQVPRR